MKKATPLNTQKTRVAKKPTSSPQTSKPSSPSSEIDQRTNSFPIFYDTATLKGLEKLCKSLLTTTAEYVAATHLKQKRVELSAIHHPRVRVQTCKPSKKISDVTMLPTKVTISFNAILKERTAGQSQPTV